MKKYYAVFCSYGSISPMSFGGNGAHTVYRFDSKPARDQWVDNNCYNATGNIVAWAKTRSEAEEYAHIRFSKIDGASASWVRETNEMEVLEIRY